MATKPRIPVFRSKLPGLQSASRLPRTKLSSRSSQEGSSSNEAVGGTLKSKYNAKAKNNRCEVTDNIRFIDKNGNRNNISAPKHEQITVVNSVHESSIESAQDIEENCEVVSLCSAEPSPNKSHHGVTGHSDKEENGNYSEFYLTGENGVEFEALAPDLIAFKRFQELSRTTSPTGSTVSNDSDNHTRARLPLPSSTFVKNKPKSVHSKTKPSNFGASKPKTLYQRGKEKRIGLPTKSTTISPSNAMDYVRQITNRSTSLEVKLARRRNETKTEPTRKVSAPARQGAKGDGKWTTDLDAAMNLNRRQSQPTIDESEEVVSNTLKDRLERKKLYQENRNRPDNLIKSNDEVSERYRRVTRRFSADDFNQPTIVNARRHKAASSTSSAKSPKIARPVIRPPRMRINFSSEGPNHHDGSNDDSDSSVEPKEQEDEAVKEQRLNFTPLKNGAEKTCDDISDDVAAKCILDNKIPIEGKKTEEEIDVRRRGSVPVTMGVTQINTRGRMRRRASSHENGNSHKRGISGISEESGYVTVGSMEGGDNLGSDFKLRQERLRQSERYKDIMENPNIVTFGQYRLKQEGNYAPEEMYGETERRRIRSSTDSDTRSPTRRHQPLLENGHCDVINGNMNNNGAVSSKSIGKSGQDEGSTDTDSSHDTYNADEERSLSVFEDLPSLNSTAMMADYSICSNASDQQSPNTLNTEHNDTNQPVTSPTDRPAPPNNTINKLLKGGLNGIFDSYTARPSAFGRPIQHSSPLRDRVAMDDINKFSSASGGSLQERLDEMLAEYKVVRVALEQLYKCLDKEEEQKAKLENENRSLWGKNVDMTKEVVRLNKLLDSKGESNLPLHHNIPKVTQSTQTDSEPMKNMWYKTELRSIEDDIKEAAKHLKQVKEIKANFSREIDEAELKLDRLLEGRFWTDTWEHPPDP